VGVASSPEVHAQPIHGRLLQVSHVLVFAAALPSLWLCTLDVSLHSVRHLDTCCISARAAHTHMLNEILVRSVRALKPCPPPCP